MPNPPLDLPLSVSKLNEILDALAKEIRGGQYIDVKRTVGGALSLDVNLATLLPRIPKLFGRFILTGTRPKYGVYTAHPVPLPSTAIDTSQATAFTDADLGSPDTNTIVYLVNLVEANNDGTVPHYLTVGGGYEPQTFVAMYWTLDPKDGTPTYVFNGEQPDLCA